VARLGNIIYRICRLGAILTALYGWWWSYWAPDNKLLVFLLFLGPAVGVWLAAKGLRFLLAQV
jgi:hypothetical protein